MAEQEDTQFEAWWASDGQYMRAGGGEYEKTFAYEAWQAARNAALEEAVDRITDVDAPCDASAAAIEKAADAVRALKINVA